MFKKTFSSRLLAGILILCFSLTLLPTQGFAEPDPLPITTIDTMQPREGDVDLYALSELSTASGVDNKTGNVLVAQNKVDQQDAQTVEKKGNCDCCGDFWDIHFGGYRWAWWALAGVGLIAIHAN